MLARAGNQGRLVINPIVYAEVAAAYETITEVDDALPSEHFTREPVPWAAAFVAGRAFVAYRKRSGQKRSPRPDFFIGAHAAVAGYTLLTRDATRYRHLLPDPEDRRAVSKSTGYRNSRSGSSCFVIAARASGDAGISGCRGGPPT